MRILSVAIICGATVDLNGCGGDDKKSAIEVSKVNGTFTNEEENGEENEEDADNRNVPNPGAKNLGDSSTRTQGSLTADRNAAKKLGGPESNPNANDLGGSQTTSGAGGSQTASSQRVEPVGETAFTLYRGLPIVAPTTQRGQEIAARIATTPADESLLARIGSRIVGGPEFLNDPFTSVAVSSILAAGDNRSHPKYMYGIFALNSLRQIHAMRDLLGPEANVSNMELYSVLKSTQANGGISDLITGGDVAAYFTTPATAAAGGGSPRRNIMQQVLRNFRAHSVKSIVDRVMGVTSENEGERRHVSEACATETEALPMHSLERPIGVRECLVTQGITLGRDHEEMIVGSPFALTPQVTALPYSNSAIRLRQYQSAIIRGLLDEVIELIDSSVTNANRRDRVQIYKGVIEQDDTLVKKLITLAYLRPVEPSDVQKAILMILPLDTIGAVPLAVAEDEIPPE